MSPKICIESFMEPIQLFCFVSGEGGTTSATGFPKARDPKWLLRLSDPFQQGKTLRLELRNGNFFHGTVLMTIKIISWSEIMVIINKTNVK